MGRLLCLRLGGRLVPSSHLQDSVYGIACSLTAAPMASSDRHSVWRWPCLPRFRLLQTPCYSGMLGGLLVLVGSLTSPPSGRLFEPSYMGRLLCLRLGGRLVPSSHLQDSVYGIACSLTAAPMASSDRHSVWRWPCLPRFRLLQTPCYSGMLGGLLVLVGSLTSPPLGRLFEPSYMGRLLCLRLGGRLVPSSHLQDSVYGIACSLTAAPMASSDRHSVWRWPCLPRFRLLQTPCYSGMLGGLLVLVDSLTSPPSGRLFEPSYMGRLLCLRLGGRLVPSHLQDSVYGIACSLTAAPMASSDRHSVWRWPCLPRFRLLQTPCYSGMLGGLLVLVGSLTSPSQGRMFEPSYLGRLLCLRLG